MSTKREASAGWQGRATSSTGKGTEAALPRVGHPEGCSGAVLMIGTGAFWGDN